MMNLLSKVGYAVMLLYLAFILFFEQPFLSYQVQPVKVLTPVVVAGNFVSLEVVRCNTDIEKRLYPVAHSLISDDNSSPPHSLKTQDVAVAPGCGTAVIDLLIPPATKTGSFHIEAIAEIRATVRRIDINWRGASFQVIGLDATRPG